MGLERGGDRVPTGDRAESELGHDAPLVWRLSGKHGALGGRTPRDKEGPGAGSAFAYHKHYAGMATVSGGAQRSSYRAIAQGSGHRRQIHSCTAGTRGSLCADREAERGGRGTREGGVLLWKPRTGCFYCRGFCEARLQGCAAKLARRIDGNLKARLRVLLQHRRGLYAPWPERESFGVAGEGVPGA